jgi:Ca-activated chloride channel family protein
MIRLEIRPHRQNLKAETPEAQKLYVMLKLLPTPDLAACQPSVGYALVIDTSGSMQGEKLDLAIRASHALVDDDRLTAFANVAVIKFDDDAECLQRLVPVSQKDELHRAINRLRDYSGGTMMARGMRCALGELQQLSPHMPKRVFLLTDGETSDETDCRALIPEFRTLNVPVITMGIGDEYNETLLAEIAEGSCGRPYALADIKGLGGVLDAEIRSSVKEVATDLRLNIGAVKSVKLDGISRVYPSLAQVSAAQAPYRLGNAAAGDFTVFIVDLTVSGLARPVGRARLIQLGLTAEAPGAGRRIEFPIQDVWVSFTKNEADLAAVDAEVLNYVQQRNLDGMMSEAMRLASVDPKRAGQTLLMARHLTQRLGNAAITKMLDNALDELNNTGAIKSQTRKTVVLGGKTKTMKAAEALGFKGLTPEEMARSKELPKT